MSLSNPCLLTPEQIHYMRSVLGVDGVLFPSGNPQIRSAADSDAQLMTGPVISAAALSGVNAISIHNADLRVALVPSSVRVRGVAEGARLLVLVASRTSTFPLDGAAGELAAKMIQAMKLSEGEVLLIEWTNAQMSFLPTEAAHALNVFSEKCVLVFGDDATRAVCGDAIEAGTVVEVSGARLLSTYSPRELLASPEKKRIAWVHLQTVMKLL